MDPTEANQRGFETVLEICCHVHLRPAVYKLIVNMSVLERIPVPDIDKGVTPPYPSE